MDKSLFAGAIALGCLAQFSRLAGRSMRGWKREVIDLFTLLAMLAIVSLIHVDIWMVIIILVIHFARVLGNDAGKMVGKRVARKVGHMYLEGHPHVTPRAALRQLIREAMESAKPVTRNRFHNARPFGGVRR